MQLQKFVGESMPVVLSTLKDALGADAIILANRRVGDHIEIIATGSLDEASIDNAELFETEHNVTAATAPATATVEKYVPTRVDPVTGASVESATNVQAEQPAEQSGDIAPTPSHYGAEHNAEPAPNNSSNNSANEALSFEGSVTVDGDEKNDTQATEHGNEAEPDAASDVETQVDAEAAAAASAAAEEKAVAMADSIAVQVNIEVEKKLEQFHTTMNQRLSQLEVNMWGEKDPIKSKLLQNFLEIGLGAELAVALVNRVDASNSFEEAMRQSLSDLANTLPIASDRTLTHDGVTLVTGPSGAGKTTTLLKLASHKMTIAGPDSVVMICADAKRIGAFESLAAYGHSLGVSVVCATSQSELKELLSFYANKELVLVDLPFDSEFKDLDIPGISASEKNVIDINERSVRHLLVLPATIQSSVAEGVVSEFSKHSSARCVITNLDRPCRVGELFTTIVRHNLRVAYWSECGDIRKPLNRASAQTLVAAAMAMGKRLMPSEDEKYLMDLIHPRFSASIVPMLRGSL